MLICWSLCWGAPKPGILVVFDSTSSVSTLSHKGLVELLKQKRAEGHFAGANIDQQFNVYNMAEPGHAATLKGWGISKTSKPFICLTSLDKAKRPAKLVWRSFYSTPEEALQALDQQLGIASVTQPNPYNTPNPYNSPTPDPYKTPEPAYTPEPPRVSPDRIVGGTSLAPGSYIEAPNHMYKFLVQSDGNCVVFKGLEPIWSTGTNQAGCKLMLGSRGKLMMVNPGGDTVWETGEDGPSGDYYLQMQEDGNLVVYRRSGPDQFTCMWASKREGASLHPPR